MKWLLDRFLASPEKHAFIHNGRTVSYQDLAVLIVDYQSKLQLSGVCVGDRVVVQGDYSPEIFCMMLALALNNSLVIPISNNSVVTKDSILEVSGSDWVVEFSANGIDYKIKHNKVDVQNELLSDFISTGEPGLILFSSGSTGKPKGILHNFNLVVEKFRTQRDAIIAIPFLMIDHFGGINTILAITSSLGTVVTVSDRSAEKICCAIQDYKVELLPTTPSFLTLLLASKLVHQFNLSSLKKITYGTEVMPQSTLDRIKLAFPSVKFQQTYGLSEVGVLRSESKDDGSLWVKIGGNGFQTKIIDNILWIKSEYAMVGYLNAPSEFDEEGWFNTQDQVEIDGDYFRILGRITDLINVGGQKVYPAEVESVILGVDNVLDVAVLGQPHNLLGQIVVAKVNIERSEDLESLKKRIRKECLSKLDQYKAPVKVIITDEPLHNMRQKKVRR